MAAPSRTPVENAIRTAIESAVLDAEGTRSRRRQQAMAAYRGDPYGDEEEGRSRFVMTDFRDTVKTLMPSLMRVFFGSERAVEYAARTPEDIPFAEQATDFISQVVLQLDNEGFLIFKGWFTDALTQWIGTVKIWWEEKPYQRTCRYSLPAEADTPKDEQKALDAAFVASKYPDLPEMPEFERVDDVLHVMEKWTEGRARFDVLPPESLLYSPESRTPEQTPLIGDRTYKTRADLIAMGINKDMLTDDLFTFDANGNILNPEPLIRDPFTSFRPSAIAELPATATTEYIEAYITLPIDEEDHNSPTQWFKCCVAGPGRELIAELEATDWHPYALLSPDPQPHRLEGFCTADDTMDIQQIKTKVTRATMDSLAESVVPRRWVVENQVEMGDVLTNKRGHPIRVKAPGMIGNLDMPFVGQQTLPLLDYFTNIRESRTGITKAAAGLNADALQSSTKSAVDATVNAAQQQLELTARLFAETGIKTFYRKLLRLVSERQSGARVVRLRGKEFVAVDPSEWDANMDVFVRVALGAGLTESRLQALAMIAQKQEQIIQMAGPDNPLAGLAEYRATLAKMVELSGLTDPSQFFKPIDPNAPKPPPAPPPPDPAMILAQVEREKMQADAQMKREQMQFDMQMATQRLQFDREKSLREDDRKRDEALAQNAVQLEQIRAQNHVDISRAQLDADFKALQLSQQGQGTT